MKTKIRSQVFRICVLFFCTCFFYGCMIGQPKKEYTPSFIYTETTVAAAEAKIQTPETETQSFTPPISGKTSQTGSIAELFKQVCQSVVVIHTLTGRQNVSPDTGESKIAERFGSGFIISDKGLVMTAAHLVHTADRIFVHFPDDREIAAEIISSVPYSDIALLQLKEIPTDLVVAETGNSDDIRTGDRIFVVGAPYNIDYTLTVGYVSGRQGNRIISEDIIPTELLQIDAAVNAGNSGGPIFNLNGKVVGIASHTLSKPDEFEDLGFGVAMNTASRLLFEKDPFWTGIDFLLISDDLAAALNISQEAGLLIQRIASDSPAGKSGLNHGTLPAIINNKDIIIGGDIVLEINDHPISKDRQQLIDIFKQARNQAAGTDIQLKIFRNGKKIELLIKR